MYQVVLAKFTQHPALRTLLLETGDKCIIEHTHRDAYWADAGDGSGKNRLGEILMQVRSRVARRLKFNHLFKGAPQEAIVMDIYTLGYGGRSPETVVALLRTQAVQTVVDVRLRPDRASMGVWVKAKTPDKGIEGWLSAAGIGYRSLIELGNVFLDFPDWQPRYQQLLAAAGGLLTERLHAIPGPICLLCAEKHVADCHRLQIAEYFAIHSGVTVHHLE